MRKASKTVFNNHCQSFMVILLIVKIALFGTVAVSAPGSTNRKDGENVYLQRSPRALFLTKDGIRENIISSSGISMSKNGNQHQHLVNRTKSLENEELIVRQEHTHDENSRNDTEFCKTTSCYLAAAQISEAIDTSIDPCEDFYQFACGGWIDKYPVTSNQREGVYDNVVQIANHRIKLILETEAKPGDPLPLHMTRTMFKTCLDTETMDALGLEPLMSSLKEQGGWPMIQDSWDVSHFDLQTAIVNLRDILVFPLLAVSVDKNLHNTTSNIIYVNAGTVPLGVGLMSNPTDTVLEAYQLFMNKAAKYMRDELSQSVTDEEISLQVDEVIQFEIEFSKLVIAASSNATDHVWLTEIEELQQYTDEGSPGVFNWLAFLKQTFSKSGVIVTSNEPILSFNGFFFAEFSNLISGTDHRVLANAIGWWWVFEMAQETTTHMRDIELVFLESLGTSPLNRTDHCLQQTNLNLAYAVARDYVDNFFTQEAKLEASQMVEDVRAAFDTLLDENTWMTSDDLVVAKEKLEAVDALVAYPDWILDDTLLTSAYSGIDITNKQHYNNLIEIGKWFDLYSLQSLREDPVHRFAIPPIIVNAFYKAEDNAITITAGILQNPYFSHDSLAALNYGGIGFFMGHEITHGFDTIGRLYDKDGNLVQWWSDETIEAYNQRALCFVDQYNHFYPPELMRVGINISVNGLQTLPENIADNGGIREAYRAYQLYVDRHGEEPSLPGLEDYSPEQIFYMGFAYTWCSNEGASKMLEQLIVDAHSPDRFRVFGSLSNDEDFSRVWNCPSGSPMNRGEDRCVLW